MRRILPVLMTILLVAVVAAGAAWYVFEGSHVPVPTVGAAEIELDAEPLDTQANSPLETPDKPQPSPEPEPPAPKPEVKPEPTKEVETLKPALADPRLEAVAKELEKSLASGKLTDEEKERIVEELRNLAGELAKFQVTLSGRVLDHAGQPMAGASVMVSSVAGDTGRKEKKRNAVAIRAIATTDVEGNFEGSYAPATRTEAAFEIELYARSTLAPESEHQKLAVTPGETYTGLVINMPESAGITGRVVDNNFNPIAGVRVNAGLNNLGESRGRGGAAVANTDADGRFTILGLGAGTYLVSAAMVGYSGPGVWPSIEVTAGEPTALGSDIIMTMQTGLKVKLSCAAQQPTGRFTANLYRADGTTLRGSGTADKDGNAIITNVLNDVTEMEIVMRGYITTARIAIAPVAGAHTDLGEITLEQDPQVKSRPMRGDSDGEAIKSAKD